MPFSRRLKTALVGAVCAAGLRAAAAASGAPTSCTVDLGGVKFDFSSLTLSTGSYSVNATDGTGDFVYEFNVCGALENGCGTDGDAMACQEAPSGVKIATLARWDDSVTLGAAVDGNPVLKAANGDKCFPAETPRTLSLEFVCSPNRRVGDISVLSTGCDYAISMETSLACPSKPVAGDCSLTQNGVKYDLSPLRGKQLTAADASGQYNYTLSVCDSVPASECGGKTGEWACQSSANGGGFSAALGSWTTDGDGGVVWALDVDGNPTATTENGDLCFPSNDPRRASIEFICTPDVPLGRVTVVEDSPCTYAFSVPTMHACGGL